MNTDWWLEYRDMMFSIHILGYNTSISPISHCYLSFRYLLQVYCIHVYYLNTYPLAKYLSLLICEHILSLFVYFILSLNGIGLPLWEDYYYPDSPERSDTRHFSNATVLWCRELHFGD